MTGPNLLAWAKELMDPLASPNVANLFSLARAILADEEERKRSFSVTIGGNMFPLVPEGADLDGVEVVELGSEPPSE